MYDKVKLVTRLDYHYAHGLIHRGLQWDLSWRYRYQLQSMDCDFAC